MSANPQARQADVLAAPSLEDSPTAINQKAAIRRLLSIMI